MVEFSYSIGGNIHNGTNLQMWRDEYLQSMRALNRNPDIGENMATRMRRAGLVAVETQMYPIPIGAYHTGE